MLLLAAIEFWGFVMGEKILKKVEAVNIKETVAEAVKTIGDLEAP